MTRRYPTYRDSGVEWLGEVPAGWALSPLKHVADFINGAAFKPDTWSEEGTPIIRIENLNGGTDFNCYEGEINERYLVTEGDILFGWSGNRGTSFGPFIWGKTGRFYLNQHIFNVKGFSCDRKWFYWCLRAATYYVEQKAHGIIGMVHITKGDLGEINIPLPSMAEQTAIAAFLDRETAKIDALVAEQRRLIDLLREKRQAVISHAVTRGLNPSAKLKPSGVEWLGDVPEGWEVKSLKRAVTFQRGHDLPSDARVEGSIPVVSSGGVIGFHDEPITEKPTIVTGRYGTIGNFQLVDEPCWPLNTALYSIDIYGNNAVFILYMMQAYRDHFILNSSKSAVPGVDRNDIHSVSITLPPLDEQHELAEFLQHLSAQLDTLTATAEAAITLLQERRAALISAAVTGKIDVRDLVAAQTEAA